MSELTSSSFEEKLNLARNEALSYYNTNAEAVSAANLRAIEAFQILQERQLARAKTETLKPLKVVFLLPELALWDVYSPIYQRMIESPLFDPLVIAFDRADILPEKSADETRSMLQNMNINSLFVEQQNGFYPSLADFAPDLVFYTLGTVAYPPAYRIEFVSRFCLTSYLAYGFMMVDEAAYQFGQSFHHSAWRVFASTPREEVEYRSRSARLTDNVVAAGYPKFDIYPTPVPAPPARPVIIWAPHWTIGLIYPALNLGMFAEICNDMYALMQSMPGVDFIFKPHPNLRYACEKTTFMDREAYDRYLGMLDALPNVSVATDGNNVERFVGSSAMITDSVSFLAEYLPSGRPLLFLDRPDRARFSDTGERIVGAHYKGRDMADVKRFIQDVVDGNDPQADRRKQALVSELNIGEVPASDRIIAELQRRLFPDREP